MFIDYWEFVLLAAVSGGLYGCYLDKTRLAKQCAALEDTLEQFVDHMNEAADRLDDAKYAFVKTFAGLDTFTLSFPEDLDQYDESMAQATQRLNAMGFDQIGLRRHRVLDVLAGRFRTYS